MKLNLKYASEVLGEIEKYPQGSIILAKLQTGTGKTTAIIGADKISGLMDKISDKTIIYLCNRWSLKNQVKLSLCQKKNVDINYNDDGSVDYAWLEKQKTIGNVTVISYQELQEILFNTNKIKYENPDDWYMRDDIFSLGDFDYIVADEFHYVVRDAGFNSKTMLCYEEIFRTWYDNSVLLMLTATDCEVRRSVEDFINKCCELTNADDFIKAVGKNKVFKKEYYHYLDGGIDYSYLNVKYFKNKKDMITTIRNNDKKWIWFVSSVSSGKALAENLKFAGIDAEFVSSDMNLELKKYIIENERFECKVLITTSVLDNGINIKDDNVINVIIEAFDEVSFVQMLGRKRIYILNAQFVNLYIPVRNSSNYTKKIELLQEKMEIIRLFYENFNQFERKTSYNLEKLQGAFYRGFDNELCLNKTYLCRLVNDLTYYKECANGLEKDKWFFIKEQLRWLDLEDAFDESNLIENVADDEEVGALEEYLEGLVGKTLHKEEQYELINRINIRVDGHQQKSISKLNIGLEMLGIMYRIKSKVIRENGKRFTIWYVESK